MGKYEGVSATGGLKHAYLVGRKGINREGPVQRAGTPSLFGQPTCRQKTLPSSPHHHPLPLPPTHMSCRPLTSFCSLTGSPSVPITRHASSMSFSVALYRQPAGGREGGRGQLVPPACRWGGREGGRKGATLHFQPSLQLGKEGGDDLYCQPAQTLNPRTLPPFLPSLAPARTSSASDASAARTQASVVTSGPRGPRASAAAGPCTWASAPSSAFDRADEGAAAGEGDGGRKVWVGKTGAIQDTFNGVSVCHCNKSKRP